VVEEFFPKGGLVHQQSETEVGPKGEIILSSRLSRLGPVLHEYSLIDPLLGLGYGTRVTGRATIADNAIVLDDEWLDTLLETGLLGVLAWMWLFGRGIRRTGARAKLERDSPEGWLAVAFAASLSAFAVAMFLYDAFGFVQGTFFAFTLVGLAGVLLRLPVTVAAGVESNEAPAPSTSSQPITFGLGKPKLAS
jgi:O-antigen ligase